MRGRHVAGARPVVSLGVPEFVASASEPLLCRTDPDAFHVDGVRPAGARALCAGCSYVEACGAYAVERPSLWGVWGGMTRGEREAVRRGRSRVLPHDPLVR